MNDQPGNNTLTPGLWRVEPSKSTVGFVTKNFLGMKVTGQFTDIDAAIHAATTPVDCSIRVALPVRSVTTGSRLRDKDLQKKKIFHSEQWSDLRFESTNIEIADSGEITITGSLRVRDHTDMIELVATEAGSGRDQHHYRASGHLNPRDFGISHPFVRHRVDLTIDVWLVPAEP